MKQEEFFIQNELDEKYIYKLISEMERKYIAEILNNGYEAWPLTKISIFRVLSNHSSKYISKKQLIPKIFVKFVKAYHKYKRLIIQNICAINYEYDKEIYKSKNIFFSRSLYLDRLKSGKSFDRIVDPFYLTSSANVSSIKFYLDNLFLSEDLYCKGLKYKKNILHKLIPGILNSENIKLEKECIYFLELFLKQNNLGKLNKIIYFDIKKSINKYLNAKYTAKKFFRKFKNLKKIFVSAWYFSDSMGLIAAANEMQIETIDIQHGKQGKYQAAYSGWSAIPEKGFLNVPNYFWCWGEKSVNNILNNSIIRNNHSPLLIGYPWPIWYSTYISKNKDFKESTKIRLLFTMQKKKGDILKEPLEDGLINIIKKYNDTYKNGFTNEFHLRVRLHPNNLEDSYEYLKKRLGALYNSRIISFSSKRDVCLFDDLNWANYHLTCFSSCALEALTFNLKTAVYGDLAYEIYSEEIQNNALIYLKNCNFNELTDFLKPDVKKFKSYSTKYICNKFPDPNLFK